MGEAGQFQIVQCLLDQCLALRPGPGGHGEQQILTHGHVGKQQVVLKQNADAALFRGPGVDARPLRDTVPSNVNTGASVPHTAASRLDLPEPLAPMTVCTMPGGHSDLQIADQHGVDVVLAQGQAGNVNLQTRLEAHDAAIEMGADAVDIGKTIHPHPTLGESIGMAAEIAHGSCTDVPPARK